MKLYKTAEGIFVEKDHQVYELPSTPWHELVNRDELFAYLTNVISGKSPIGDAQILETKTIQAPIDLQEVWASGVTYLRSRNARMEESKEAGGDTFYDKVYEADRPELFFKATAARVVGTGQKVRIRKDSTWDVPEPEMTLLVTSSGKIVAYTIGNDMSSRSIEGENPLYLPQAKTYEKCAGLGPCLYVTDQEMDPKTDINLKIFRAKTEVFNGTVGISQMKRKFTELVGFLTREYEFPYGCFLMTGTGIVPDHPFTLQQNDEIHISIDHIGTLINTVE